MPVLPLEVWDNIVSRFSSLSQASSDEVEAVTIRDYAACTATSRLLSTAVRPYLYHTVTLSKEAQGRTLLELITADDKVAQWIKRLKILQNLAWSWEHNCAESLLRSWLDSTAGNELMGRLTSVKTLEIFGFRSLGPTSNRTLPTGWSGLLRLNSITSLALQDSAIPSSHEVSEIFGGAHPHLHTVDINQVYLEDITDMTTPTTLPVHLVNSKIRRLKIRNDFFYSDGLSWLLGSMHCSVLTHLVLAPALIDVGVGDASFGHAQPLLDHAPALDTLTLLDLDRLPSGSPSPRLTSNTSLQHLSCEGVGEELPVSWIPNLLASIVNPSQLQTLAITGELAIIPLPIWEALDIAISDSRFECSEGERVLRLRDIEEAFEGNPWSFLHKHFKRTQELGWFRIMWPAE